MPEWCVPCWTGFKQRTAATRTHDDEPMCQPCAVRLEYEERAEVKTSPDLASAAAGEGSPSHPGPSPATGFSADPEASPGSFGAVIKKVFLPKHPAKGDRHDVETKQVPKGEAMPKRVEVDWDKYDRLVGTAGLSLGQIAEQLGVGYSTLAYKIKQRHKQKSKSKTSHPTAAPQKASITLALPESAIDGFLLKLPIERKAEIFTAELAASR